MLSLLLMKITKIIVYLSRKVRSTGRFILWYALLKAVICGDCHRLWRNISHRDSCRRCKLPILSATFTQKGHCFLIFSFISMYILWKGLRMFAHCFQQRHLGLWLSNILAHPWYPLYTGMATLVPPLRYRIMARSPLKAQRSWKICLGRSRVTHRTLGPHHRRHDRREVWACSNMLHIGRRGGVSLTGRSKEARGKHRHHRGHRMGGSVTGWPVEKIVLL